MPTVSPRYDIKSLIEHYASIEIFSDAVVHGVREYHSNCPWCGGEDRFVMRPETGQYTCSIRSSGCGRHGDGVDFLKEYAQMLHHEACEELGLEGVSFYDRAGGRDTNQYDSNLPPSKQWQETGMLLVERAERYLWRSDVPKAVEMLTYLRARGLKDETIRKKRYGYVPLDKDGRWYMRTFEEWGLDPEKLTDAQREKGGVRVPPGILIPWFESSTLWKLTIKRPGEKVMPYGQILGSGKGMYNIDAVQYGMPCLMVEAEFCAAIAEQEAGDIISVVATGGTPGGRSGRWIAELSLASFVLQAFDNDKPDEDGKMPGDDGAEYWLERIPDILRWKPWKVKDINDMLCNGLPVRQWVQDGIESHNEITQAKDAAHYESNARDYIQGMRAGKKPDIRPDVGPKWEMSIERIERAYTKCQGAPSIMGRYITAMCQEDSALASLMGYEAPTEQPQTLDAARKREVYAALEQVRVLAEAIGKEAILWNVPDNLYPGGNVSIDEYRTRIQLCLESSNPDTRSSAIDDVSWQISYLSRQQKKGA